MRGREKLLAALSGRLRLGEDGSRLRVKRRIIVYLYLESSLTLPTSCESVCHFQLAQLQLLPLTSP